MDPQRGPADRAAKLQAMFRWKDRRNRPNQRETFEKVSKITTFTRKNFLINV